MIARVAPDVAGIRKTFDYRVPEGWENQVVVGTMVRVVLAGRRIGGWVVAVSDEPSTDRPLAPLAKITGCGPAPELVDLARWAAWRWAGRPTAFLRTASPLTAVRNLPSWPKPRAVAGVVPSSLGDSAGLPASEGRREVVAVVARRSLASQALDGPLTVVRVPPAADVLPFVLAAAELGDALVLAPSSSRAATLAAALSKAGHSVALLPRDWARAAAGGGVAVGARAAAWAPRHCLKAVVVIDEHDEAYQEERVPTWNARDIAIERARRAGVPCVLLSPCPTLDALALAPLLVGDRADERAGWPAIEVVDRREEPPGSGLYSPRLVAAVRHAVQAGAGPVVCVLNRRGRARLLVCATCGEMARCHRCQSASEQTDGGLWCRRCHSLTAAMCTQCGGLRFKALRVGVTRAREELEVLVGCPVGEVTGASGAEPLPDAAVLVGTEALLHRAAAAALVVFLDFDQELLAPRYRAAEAALALLARAGRLVGGRSARGRILIQTRLPTHEVLAAATHADPSLVAEAESIRRVDLRFPPASALALVSGEGASQFVDLLAEQADVEILGPSDGRWLVRAPGHQRLCDALAATPRPPGRLRLEVDPLRV